MGNNKSTPMQAMLQQEIMCTDDLMCQNIDSKRSIPGKDLVLVCPKATCLAGKCMCGNDCERDPYTGMCCTSIEERVTQTSSGQEKVTFCIEGEPSVENPKGLLEAFSSNYGSYGSYGSSVFSGV